MRSQKFLPIPVLTQSADLRKQVIVHELLYVQVPKHGKQFKTLLRSY